MQVLVARESGLFLEYTFFSLFWAMISMLTVCHHHGLILYCLACWTGWFDVEPEYVSPKVSTKMLIMVYNFFRDAKKTGVAIPPFLTWVGQHVKIVRHQTQDVHDNLPSVPPLDIDPPYC